MTLALEIPSARRFGAPFRKVWSAAAISNLGDGLLLAALPLLASSLTTSAVAVTGLVTMRYAAWLVLGLFGGVAADRSDRRRVMVAVDIGRTVVVAALGIAVIIGAPPVALLWATAFLLGCGEVFFDSAAQAMLPNVLDDDALLERANSRIYATESVGTELVGPPIGAWLFAAAAALPFLLDAASFLGAALIVASLVGTFRPKPAVALAPDAPARPADDLMPARRRSVRHDLGEAWQFVRQERLLRSLIVLGCAWNFFAVGAEATVVLFARRVLGVSAGQYGFVLTGLAIGGIAAALLTERITAAIGPGTTILTTFLLGGVAGTVAAISNSVVLFVAAFGLSFAAGTTASIVVVTLRQQLVPDALRGRVTSFFRVLIFAAGGLGALVMGLLGSAVSLRAPMLALGIAGFTLFLAASREISNTRIAAAQRATSR